MKKITEKARYSAWEAPVKRCYYLCYNLQGVGIDPETAPQELDPEITTQGERVHCPPMPDFSQLWLPWTGLFVSELFPTIDVLTAIRRVWIQDRPCFVERIRIASVGRIFPEVACAALLGSSID